MQISTRSITLLDFAKLAIYGIFLNYYCINILRGSLIPYGTVVFYVIAGACVLVSVFGEKIRLSTEIGCWIAYATFSLVTAVFAVSSSAALKGIGEYVQRLILIIMIAFICEKEQSVKFAIRLLAVIAIACAISSLLMIESISTKLTMITGATVSTNDIGALMAFGCFAVLFAFGLGKKKNFLKTTVKIAYIIGAVTVIILAGSRKSIIAVFILFGLLFLLCAKDLFRSISTAQFIIVTLLIVTAAVVVYVYLLPNFEQTDMYARLFGRKVEGTAESDEIRIKYYQWALQDFTRHPLFGLGYNNYFVKHGSYSHSAYVEPLACSGIGGFLYLAPYVMILVKQIKLIKLNKHNQQERLWQKELLAFYFSFLFVGIGIPYIYKDIPCIILAMFIASQEISFSKLEEHEMQPLTEGVSSEPITNQGTASTV